MIGKRILFNVKTYKEKENFIPTNNGLFGNWNEKWDEVIIKTTGIILDKTIESVYQTSSIYVPCTKYLVKLDDEFCKETEQKLILISASDIIDLIETI
jgi:hypothetical protein